uniref:Putative sugar transporter n=1 Tax=Phaedon cochleariae TaxID=80249 RepID=W4VS24_PHACE
MMNNIYAIVCTGNLITFSVGTAITWASPELDKLEEINVISNQDQRSWVSSLFQLGGLFGPFVYGFMADKVGRKNTILAIGVPLLVGYLLMAFVRELASFYVSRFIIGLATGGMYAVLPNYVSEISEKASRGTFSCLLNVFQCSGMLFCYAVGPYTSVVVFNFILAIFPAACIILFYLLAIESPHYLIKTGQYDLAKSTIESIRGKGANVESELAMIEKAIEEEGRPSVKDICRSKGNKKAFLITVVLLCFQQLTGINAILTYAQTIFKDSGTSIPPEICSMIIGAVQLGASFLTPIFVDKLGRKMLLIISAIGMVLSELPLGLYSHFYAHQKEGSNLSYLPIVCLVVFILTYNVGFAQVPWTIMAEMFPTGIRSKAASLVTAACLLLGFFIVKYFEQMSNNIGLGVCFMIFSVCCAVSTIFVKFVVIETSKKSLEEIQTELNS